MQIVKHEKVVEVVKPETFDLIGLTPEQMAVLFILTGNSSGWPCGLYQAVQDALGCSWLESLPGNDKPSVYINANAIDLVLSTRK